MQPRRAPLHRPTGAVWLVLGLAATLLGPAADIQRLRPGDVPLNWDIAGHLLHADAIRVALRQGDLPALAEQLRLWSVYPPLYHLGVGAWTAVLGFGSASVRLFLWLTPALAVLGCWLGLRTLRSPRAPAADLAFLAFAALLPGLAHFASLAQAWMLDAPAAALALVSLGLLARYADGGRRRDGAAAAALVTATVLVKYNFGLPLLVSIAVLGLSEIVRGGAGAASLRSF